MKGKAFVGLLLAFACSVAAPAAVRIAVREGKTVIYNDGIGESVHAALGESDAWLASRIRIPSLYDGLISKAAAINEIDPKLVKSVMLIESAFNPAAVSRKGARGLMQLMPETAARHGVRDLFDPVENIAGGALYLKELLDFFGGNLTKSLAAYNAGETAVLRYGGVPPYDETQIYVRKGLTAYYGKTTGETWTLRSGRSVRVTRDENDRPVITTEPASRRARRS
jgi:soluble lytic murein transglycosylase-like protein